MVAGFPLVITKGKRDVIQRVLTLGRPQLGCLGPENFYYLTCTPAAVILLYKVLKFTQSVCICVSHVPLFFFLSTGFERTSALFLITFPWRDSTTKGLRFYHLFTARRQRLNRLVIIFSKLFFKKISFICIDLQYLKKKVYPLNTLKGPPNKELQSNSTSDFHRMLKDRS